LDWQTGFYSTNPLPASCVNPTDVSLSIRGSLKHGIAVIRSRGKPLPVAGSDQLHALSGFD
jgi:hypothetical protein